MVRNTGVVLCLKFMLTFQQDHDEQDDGMANDDADELVEDSMSSGEEVLLDLEYLILSF